MNGRGILSRIAGQTGPVDEATAILEHVRALLNTRRDSSVCVPSLGVVDFTDIALPGGVDQLARSIRQTLLEHEPRLRSVSVRNVPAEGELLLRFDIMAQLASRRGVMLRMVTTVRPGGRIDVRR
jgi:type VI secretion system lysozyme-like protein